MLKQWLISSVALAASADVLWYGYSNATELKAKCYTAEAIHDHNRFLWDTVRIKIKQGGTPIVACSYHTTGFCLDAKKNYASFDPKTGKAVAVLKDFLLVFPAMQRGFRSQRVKYGRKFYFAKSAQCPREYGYEV